jgi:hypothetical protein
MLNQNIMQQVKMIKAFRRMVAFKGNFVVPSYKSF